MDIFVVTTNVYIKSSYYYITCTSTKRRLFTSVSNQVSQISLCTDMAFFVPHDQLISHDMTCTVHMHVLSIQVLCYNDIHSMHK